jgi:hypothetical protein
MIGSPFWDVNNSHYMGISHPMIGEAYHGIEALELGGSPFFAERALVAPYSIATRIHSFDQ